MSHPHRTPACLWQRLRASWRAEGLPRHLAQDTGLPEAPKRRYLNPLIGAWLH